MASQERQGQGSPAQYRSASSPRGTHTIGESAAPTWSHLGHLAGAGGF
jgi:hypothetical protein